MTKYLISKTQYDDIIERLLSKLFKDSELKPVVRKDSPWIHDEVTLHGEVSGKRVQFRYVAYAEQTFVDGVLDSERIKDSILLIPEPVVDFISRLTKVRKTKSIDAITNWFEETYDKPIDSVSLTDKKDD